MKLVKAKCPSCGAAIEVDKNSDTTKCDYCGSKIVVDDAIAKFKLEVSGEVEIKNLPKIEGYLKNGEREYKNYDYILLVFPFFLDLNKPMPTHIAKKAVKNTVHIINVPK